MSTSETRSRVKDLASGQAKYSSRAYMSSGLTNLDPRQRRELCQLLEELYLEVFDPLGVFLYLPHLWSDPGHDAQISPEDVHTLDRLRIAQSDFLVLSADYPSFGVGQEFEIAQAIGMPCIGFVRKNIRVSRMLLGGTAWRVLPGQDPAQPSLSVLKYTNTDHLKEQLRHRVVELLQGLPEQEKFVIHGLENTLRNLLQSRGYSVGKLSELSGISIAFLNFLMSSREDVFAVLERWELPTFDGPQHQVKYSNVGLWVLSRIANALGVTLSDLFVYQEFTGAERRRQRYDLVERMISDIAARRDSRVSTVNRLRDSVVRLEGELAARSDQELKEWLENRAEEIEKEYGN